MEQNGSTAITLICKKRLLGEMKLLKRDPHQYIDVAPDENDLLTWYFLIKGPDFSEYNGGYYIGKIMHNPEYPLKPPDFKMLTPNGRFDIDKKICLSNTGFHSNEWSAMWNINSILTGFLSIMLDDKEHGISHIHYGKHEREEFAKKSIEYNKINYSELVKRFTRFIDADGNPVQNIKKPEVPEIKKEELINEHTKSEETLTNENAKLEVNKENKAEKEKQNRRKVIFDPTTLELDDYKNTEKEYQDIITSMKNNLNKKL